MKQKNTIVDIPKTMEKFFGCSGKMVKPGLDAVIFAVKKIPKGNLITMSILCEKLAKKFKANVACPATTGKSLYEAASASVDKREAVPFWRVIKTNGELNNKFPGGVEKQASLLRREGFDIVAFGKTCKVKNFESYLLR